MTNHGIVFIAVGRGVRVKITIRADLAIQRMKHYVVAIGAHEVIGVVLTGNLGVARKVRRALHRAFCRPGVTGVLTLKQSADALVRCRRIGLKTFARTDPPPRPSKAPPADPLHVQSRYRPDPSMSEAERLHQLALYPTARRIGQAKVDIAMSDVIGGLSRISRRTAAQEEAAGRFRSAHERAQLGGPKAVDCSQVRVDTSGISRSAIASIGEDARAELDRARKASASAPNSWPWSSLSSWWVTPLHRLHRSPASPRAARPGKRQPICYCEPATT